MSTPDPTLPDLDRDDLAPLLRPHLAVALDPFADRAAAAFREHVRRERRARTLRLTFSTLSAVAAGLVIAWFILPHRPKPAQPTDTTIARTTQPAPDNPKDPGPFQTPVVQSASWSRVYDDGLRVVDNRPIRQLRQSVVEEVQWVDPRTGAVVRQTIPKEQILYIKVNTD